MWVLSQIQALLAGTISTVNIFGILSESPYMKTYLHYSVRLVLVITPFAFLFATYKNVVIEKKESYLRILIRVVIVMLLLSVYPSMFLQTVELIDSVSVKMFRVEQIKQTLEDLDKQSNQGEEDTENQTENNGDKKSVYEKLKNRIGDFTETIFSYTMENFFVQASIFLSYMFIILIMIIRGVLLTLLLFLAPFTIPFLISDSMDKMFFGWVKFFINVLSWPIMMSLILFMQGTILERLLVSVGQYGFFDKVMLVSYNFAFILLMLVSISLTQDIMSGGRFTTGMIQLGLLKGISSVGEGVSEIGGKTSETAFGD